MPSYSFDVSRQDFFKFDKLQFFLYYYARFGDCLSQITYEVSQPDYDPLDHKDLYQTFSDNITDFVEEIHCLTEDCILLVSESLSS